VLKRSNLYRAIFPTPMGEGQESFRSAAYEGGWVGRWFMFIAVNDIM
jgi:hypothetical protein